MKWPYFFGATVGAVTVAGVAVGAGVTTTLEGASASAIEVRIILAMESWKTLARSCIICLFSAAGPQEVKINTKVNARAENIFFIIIIK